MSKWDVFFAGLFSFAYRPYAEFSRKGIKLNKDQVIKGRIVSAVCSGAIIAGIFGMFF